MQLQEQSQQSLEMPFTAEEVVNMLESSFAGADSSDDDLEMDTEEIGTPFFRDIDSRRETESKPKYVYTQME